MSFTTTGGDIALFIQDAHLILYVLIDENELPRWEILACTLIEPMEALRTNEIIICLFSEMRFPWRHNLAVFQNEGFAGMSEKMRI